MYVVATDVDGQNSTNGHLNECGVLTIGQTEGTLDWRHVSCDATRFAPSGRRFICYYRARNLTHHWTTWSGCNPNDQGWWRMVSICSESYYGGGGVSRASRRVSTQQFGLNGNADTRYGRIDPVTVSESCLADDVRFRVVRAPSRQGSTARVTTEQSRRS